MSTNVRIGLASATGFVAWLALPPAAFADDIPFKGEPAFVTTVVALIFALTVLALVWFRNAMTAAKSTWSLADALSEEVTVTPVDASGPRFDATGKALMATEMKASSSRLIAFVGAIVSVFLFLGFGTFALYQFGMTGKMPEVGDILKFLVAGTTLFAPYAVNKLSSLGSP